MRTIVDIPRENLASLDILGAQERVSRTELIRRAIEDYLRAHTASDPKAAFGIWKKKPKNALEFQRQLRREWDR